MKISIKNIAFYVFVFFISTYIILEVFAPTKTVDILGFKSYVIISPSMEPEIMVNDLIIIRKVKEDNLDISDKIAFYVYIPELNEESTVTHYIADIEVIDGVTIYKTQGANRDIGDYDEWTNELNNPVEITYDDIEGRVVLVIPNLGHVVNILKDPISIGFLVINITILYFLVKLIKAPKIEREIE